MKKINLYQFLFLYLGFLLIYSLVGLGIPYLVDWDENLYAEASKQMLKRGDYLNIYLNGEPFSQKPPLFFWLQVISYKIFGISEFSARLPSVIFCFFSAYLCIIAGKYIHSLRVGVLWGLIFTTSLLPSLLSKSAVIDITFNFWIFAASFCLFFCDRQKANQKKYFSYLILASVSMGLAVLTKGILGGAIPVFAFTLYKLFYSKPLVTWLEFFFVGFLSLLVASSWYLLNFWNSGLNFLLQFIEFQKTLLFKTAQGHSGPFYYHFIALFFGLFPWSPFLFTKISRSTIKNIISLKNFPSVKNNFAIFCIFQILIILTIFSFVTTKLPHYSSFAYFPLSYFVAYRLNQQLENNIFSKKIIFSLLLFCLLLGVFFLYFHLIMEWWLQKEQIPFTLLWDKRIYFTGSSLILGGIVSCFFFRIKKNIYAIITLALMSFFFSQGIWRLQLPLFQQYNQNLLVQQVDELQKDGKVVFYQFTAIAPIFYNNKDIPTFGSSTFSEPKVQLNEMQEENIYIITKGEKNKKKLEKESYELNFLRQVADLYIYKKK